jgi:hypothetical protein
VQSFFGKINFIRRFIPNFVEITKPICNESVKVFNTIKHAIDLALVLVSPYYSKEFQIFSFASKETIADILLQKNQQSLEQPIAFMTKLKDSELNYTTMEKQAYTPVQSLKYFMPCGIFQHYCICFPCCSEGYTHSAGLLGYLWKVGI